MYQIWKDIYFSANTTELPIRVITGGKTIYEGVLSTYPNETQVRTLLNKICAPYLSMNYPANSGVTSHPEAYKTFTVQDFSGNTLDSKDFIYDWSYEGFNEILSKPVNGHLDPRMRLFYTMYRSTAGNITVNVS